MSLRWTSRLRLGLQVRSCQVQCWRAGWSPRPQAVATGSGHGAVAIAAALDTLTRAEASAWPSRAELTVADEYVHHSLLIARTRREALEQAQLEFSAALGRQTLQVQVQTLPDPRTRQMPRWLATALASADLSQWQQELERRGVALTGWQSALAQDLERLRMQAREPHVIAVLLREEGASLVRLEHGATVSLSWEHLDPADEACLAMRLRAFIEAPGRRRDCIVYLQAESQALCRYRWDEQG